MAGLRALSHGGVRRARARDRREVRRVAALACAALSIVACSRADSSSAGSASASASATSVSSPTAPDASTTKTARASVDAGPRPVTADEIAKQRAYLADLATGRAATRAKQWDAAIDAFTQAITANPNDARAWSERGFAKLLSSTEKKTLSSASDDFDAAADRTKDPQLLSQIWFNRGLADEKLGDADHAKADFATAHELHPSAATRAKVGAGGTCPLRVTYGPTDAIGELKTSADWLALYNDAIEADPSSGPATSNADALARLVEGGKEPKLPAIVTSGPPNAPRAYLVWREGSALLSMGVGQSSAGFSCTADISFAVTPSALSDVVHVSGYEMLTVRTTVCFFPDKEGAQACDEKSFEDPNVEKQGMCAAGEGTDRDVVVDMKKHAVLIVAERPKTDDTTFGAALSPTGLAVHGLGCDRAIPFDAASDAGTKSAPKK